MTAHQKDDGNAINSGVFVARLHGVCRYDDMKTAQENIDLQTTILSRFDLIFIVKDERSMERDKRIAQHVIQVHRDAGSAPEADEDDKKVADKQLANQHKLITKKGTAGVLHG